MFFFGGGLGGFAPKTSTALQVFRPKPSSSVSEPRIQSMGLRFGVYRVYRVYRADRVYRVYRVRVLIFGQYGVQLDLRDSGGP